MKFVLSFLFLFSLMTVNATMNKLDQYQPVLELMNTVNISTQIDDMPGLAFNQSQSKQLLELFKNLSAKTVLEPNDAATLLKTLETKILSPAQFKVLVQKRLELQALAQKRRTQVRVSEGGSGTLNLYALTVPGARAYVTMLEKGEASNPFRVDPNSGIIKKFVSELEKR
jgi:hypothetical protein